MKKPQYIKTTLEKIVGGGQALGELEDGKKFFAWGGLPGETVTAQVTKKKAHFAEGIVSEVHVVSNERVEPRDPESYVSTSPWQIMQFSSERHYKATLIEEAFELHNIVLPNAIDVYTDKRDYAYRNKVEFSWYGELDSETNEDTLNLAFYRRGTHGKLPVTGTSLAAPSINQTAQRVRDILRSKHISARQLKTLLVRCNQTGECVWQLYTKDESIDLFSEDEFMRTHATGAEIIFSDPKSPASKITKRLTTYGNPTLEDTIHGVPFRYATEGFFQVNLPVYERALSDMKQWIDDKKPVVDMYAGVGTIGLTIGGNSCTLVEINEYAVREMKKNITEQGSTATAVLAASEHALDEITSDRLLIVDPPRAGLHNDVIEKIRRVQPARIIYLSCNPVTQARDIALLAADSIYGIKSHQGYNFFPRTPHIEHLVVLDRIA